MTASDPRVRIASRLLNEAARITGFPASKIQRHRSLLASDRPIARARAAVWTVLLEDHGWTCPLAALAFGTSEGLVRKATNRARTNKDGEEFLRILSLLRSIPPQP
jgi:hypothetical protein